MNEILKFCVVCCLFFTQHFCIFAENQKQVSTVAEVYILFLTHTLQFLLVIFILVRRECTREQDDLCYWKILFLFILYFHHLLQKYQSV